MRVAAVVILGALLLGVATGATAAHPAAPQRQTEAASTLIELTPAGRVRGAARLRRAGATLVSRDLGLWKLGSRSAGRVLPGLERLHLVRSVAADRVLAPLGSGAAGAPGAPREWWLQAVDAAGLTPPGPGRPVTVVDTGIDLGHPDLAGRPDTVALNLQRITSPDDFHGTAISSLIGGRGGTVSGIYPRARLLEWDASQRDGLTLSSIVTGIEAATRAGPGVINLSLGSDADVPILEDAILEAFRKGSLVVAAAGDSRGFDFSPYPASYPHVLTVAATDRRNRVASFSSASSTIDLAAPGEDVTVAVPLLRDPSGYALASGTSYSAAIVSGALAWIWTRRPSLDNTQLLTLVRRTARKRGAESFSNDTGYGVLDVRAALASPAPPPDPLEPNDDVQLVRPGGLFADGSPLLASALKRHATLAARLDANKDPADVYRVSVPPHTGLTVTVRTTSGDVALRLWGPHTPTILERGGAAERDLLGVRQREPIETIGLANRGARAETVYAAVSAGVSRTASYSLSLSLE